MQTKLFEIRDRGTCISALAIQLESQSEAERWLLARVGYGVQSVRQGEYIIVVNLSELGATYDPFGWRGSRTMSTAHQEIIKRFRELDSGSVIDVEYLLGETATLKRSEMRPLVDVEVNA